MNNLFEEALVARALEEGQHQIGAADASGPAELAHADDASEALRGTTASRNRPPVIATHQRSNAVSPSLYQAQLPAQPATHHPADAKPARTYLSSDSIPAFMIGVLVVSKSCHGCQWNLQGAHKGFHGVAGVPARAAVPAHDALRVPRNDSAIGAQTSTRSESCWRCLLSERCMGKIFKHR